MRFRVTVDATGLNRKLTLVVGKCENLKEILSQFGRYKVNRTKAIFQQQGPGWAPLKEDSEAGRISKGLRGLKRKLQRDLRKAVARGGGDKNTRGQLNRAAVLAEFHRRQGVKSSLSRREEIQKITDRQKASLDKRTARAVEKALSKPILSGLARSISSKATKKQVVIESRAEWAGVHNKGGSAGKGARIPRREFLALDQDDIRILCLMLEEYIVEAFEG